MNADLRKMMWALLAWGLGEGMFYHFQPLYLSQLGASPERIGWVLGLASAWMTVVHLPIGRLVECWGPHRLLLAGWLVGTVGAVLMAAAPTLPWFVAGLWVYHLSLFVMVPMQAYLSLVRGPWSLARVLTLTSAAFNLGTVLGPWLGGHMAARWGLRLVYAVAAGLFVLSSLEVARTRAYPWQDGEGCTPSARASWQALRALPRPVWAFALWSAVLFVLVTLPAPLLPKFLQEQRGLSVVDIGSLGTLYAIGATLANLTLGALSIPWGLSLALAAQALAAGLIWWGRGLIAYRGAYFLLGGLRAARPLAQAQAQSLTPEGQRGLTYGLLETLFGVSLAVAAPLAGLFYQRQPALLFFAPIAALAFLPLAWKWRGPFKAPAAK